MVQPVLSINRKIGFFNFLWNNKSSFLLLSQQQLWQRLHLLLKIPIETVQKKKKNISGFPSQHFLIYKIQQYMAMDINKQ